MFRTPEPRITRKRVQVSPDHLLLLYCWSQCSYSVPALPLLVALTTILCVMMVTTYVCSPRSVLHFPALALMRHDSS